MRLIKLIVPAAFIAVLALFAPHADAQVMGEYAAATAGVGTGAASMSTSVGSGSEDLGGSSTWGASALGGSFEDRVGAASASGAGTDFDSRAGSLKGGSTDEPRWPASQLSSDTSSRFNDSTDGGSGRFSADDRFPQRTELSSSSSDRFPPSSFNDNANGLDTHCSSSSGLDTHYSSSSGLDTHYSSN